MRTALLWLALGFCVPLAAGCDQATSRHGLQGTVTLDSEPLAKGSIAFVPLPGTKGPPAGGPIRDGSYSVGSDGGTFVGKFSVSIKASRKTGRKEHDSMGNLVDQFEQYIPRRYNRDTELTAEVTVSGPNRFDFELDLK